MNISPPVKIGKISYINAAPVYYGLDHGMLPHGLTLVADVPSALNRQIMTGEVVLSPISAAFYAQNYRDLLLLPDLSISCHGKVLSVLLASHHPIEDLTGKKIVFSRESASAASFLKMIFKQKKIEPEYAIGQITDSRTLSRSAQAVLVIGDKALTQPWETDFQYCIDLGELWYEMTQLPFVFAVWAVRRDFARQYPRIVDQIHQLLLASRAQGDRHGDDVIRIGQKKSGLDSATVKRYFQHLHCDLDPLKIKAMGLFFDALMEQGILTEKVQIEFFKSLV